jgi:pumilio family protein 6
MILDRFNNEDKGAVTHSVVHRALWEYLSALSSLTEDDQEKRFREMFEGCQDTLAELVHTKDGSRVVREFLARGAAKVRYSHPLSLFTLFTRLLPLGQKTNT